MNLANQSAQSGSRTHLNIRCDALGRKAPYHGLPPYWRRDLGDECLDDLARGTLRLGVDVRHHWDARMLNGERAQLWGEPLLGRLHERAVERRAHRKRHDPRRAERLGALAAAHDLGVGRKLARLGVRGRRGRAHQAPMPTGTAACM